MTQLESIYLSRSVNTNSEQRRGQMKSPASPNSHHVVPDALRISNDTRVLYIVRRGFVCAACPRQKMVPFPRLVCCVKSGRKSKPFPSLWPPWLAVREGSRGLAGCGWVRPGSKPANAKASHAGCQEQQKDTVTRRRSAEVNDGGPS